MSQSFQMVIKEVYLLKDGPAVAGTVKHGGLNVGETLVLDGKMGKFEVKVIGLSTFQNTPPGSHPEPMLLGVTLSGVETDQVCHRDVLYFLEKTNHVSTNATQSEILLNIIRKGPAPFKYDNRENEL